MKSDEKALFEMKSDEKALPDEVGKFQHWRCQYPKLHPKEKRSKPCHHLQLSSRASCPTRGQSPLKDPKDDVVFDARKSNSTFSASLDSAEMLNFDGIELAHRTAEESIPAVQPAPDARWRYSCSYTPETHHFGSKHTPR